MHGWNITVKSDERRRTDFPRALFALVQPGFTAFVRQVSVRHPVALAVWPAALIAMFRSGGARNRVEFVKTSGDNRTASNDETKD